MKKPFDPTLKALVETVPEDWPVLLGQPRAPTDVFDADIGTVSGAADKVLRVRAETSYLLHLEFQSGHDSAQLPPLLHMRNLLLEVRHQLRVRTAVILLRPEADSPLLTGTRVCAFPDEEPYAVFRYQTVRVWQLPVQPLLAGGIGTLPLAPISAVTEAELPGIIEAMQQRLPARLGRPRTASLWAATYILMGMRYSSELAALLLRGVVSMKESTTYQAILEEGEARGEAKGKIAGAKELLRFQAENRWGPPSAPLAIAFERIADLQRLEALAVKLFQVNSWHELLDLPAPRRGRRKPN
jgi:predicted transposase YdaD